MTEMQSAEIGELMSALAKAQAEMKPAIKDSVNPAFKSKFADLASVWEACREPLTKNALAVAQTFTMNEGGETHIITTLGHASGQWMRAVLPVRPVKNDPQGMGSAITYMRRYALAAMVGVSPDDDDGNAASNRNGGTAEAPKPNGRKPADPAGGAHPVTTPRNIAKTEDVMRAEVAGCKSGRDLTALWKQHQSNFDEIEKTDPDAYKRLFELFVARKRELSKGLDPATEKLVKEIQETILASESMAELNSAMHHYSADLDRLQQSAPGACDELTALADQMRNEFRSVAA